MNYIFARLKEASTHAGLATLVQGLKFFAPQYGAIIDAASALFAAIAVAVPSNSNPAK
jgi:hypothetical protein